MRVGSCWTQLYHFYMFARVTRYFIGLGGFFDVTLITGVTFPNEDLISSRGIQPARAIALNPTVPGRDKKHILKFQPNLVLR